MSILLADVAHQPVHMALACFHCGLPVPSASTWSVKIDGVIQPMCCPGCEAVAQTIADNGLTDYYRTRDGFPDAIDPALLARLNCRFTMRLRWSAGLHGLMRTAIAKRRFLSRAYVVPLAYG